MRIEFDGLDQIIEEFERLENVPQEISDDALIVAGDILLEETQKQVYQFLKRRSGDSVDALIRTKPKDGELFVGTKGGAKQPGFYLYMQEFGFFNVQAGRFLPPKPFASVAFQRSKNKMLDAQVDLVRRRLGM